jgi:hypothetical protein
MTMLPHPKTMQAITDQRWQDLRIKTGRDRLAMTTHRQTGGTAPLATLRLRGGNPVRLLWPIFGRRQEVRLSGDAQQLGIP